MNFSATQIQLVESRCPIGKALKFGPCRLLMAGTLSQALRARLRSHRPSGTPPFAYRPLTLALTLS